MAWVTLNTDVIRHEIGDSGAMWTAPEMIAALQDPPKNRHELIYHGTVAATLVATGWITLPMIDNLSSADLYVAVVPEHRRRGLGSEMLAHLEQVCAERGRTRLDAITDWPYDGAPDGAGAPGVEFGRVHGYAFGLGDVQRELQLPADDAVLAALAAEAAPHHADYELRSWAGPIPDDIVQSYLELSSTLATEARPASSSARTRPSTSRRTAAPSGCWPSSSASPGTPWRSTATAASSPTAISSCPAPIRGGSTSGGRSWPAPTAATGSAWR